MNGLQSQIQIHKAQPHEPILFPLLGPDRFDFTMCNPPFYSSREEIDKNTAEKEFSPSAVCTGADAEMITPGGESAFVRQMVTESLEYKTKCRYVLVLRRLCFRDTNLVCGLQLVYVDAGKTFFRHRRCRFAAKKWGTQT